MKSRQADDSRRNVTFPTITLVDNESMNAGTVTDPGAVGLEQATAQATDATRAKNFKLLMADVGLRQS
jgi:L-cysteine desulfidase